jgi:predicted ATPase
MIQKLLLKNFKRFPRQVVDLNSLTLFCGLNSTGKSTSIQALLLLRQSYQEGLLDKVGLQLNGELTKIGRAKDALYSDALEEKIEFELTTASGHTTNWSFEYAKEADIMELIPSSKSLDIYQESLFTNSFQYLQAERLGPRRFLEISDFQVGQHRQIGTQGEYTAHYLFLFREDNIASSALSHPSQISLKLMSQVEAWLSEVTPGTRLNISSSQEMDLVNLQFKFSGDGAQYRSTNVGFGLTYTLPIIVAILSAKPGALLLLENPEAHLHPKGQAQMGELIARAASIGIQIIVETHSDHLLNGIRLAVHGGRLKPENVTLNFFQQQSANGSFIVSPKIDRNGRIDQWPEGFFDEWDKSLDILLEPAQE